jgi:mannosyltransferase OCH1-like enzyme
MYIIKSIDNLPVKNIIFICPVGFEIKTRYINTNMCEIGLFRIDNPTIGWDNLIDIEYYEEGAKLEKYIIIFNSSSISSSITTLTTEFNLQKSTLDDLPERYHVNKKGKIPQIIVQTHKKYNFNKKEYYDASRSWILKNPGYTYIFYDDIDCVHFIKNFYPHFFLNAWNSLIPGAFKSDIFRYCVLYKLGGFYVDFDTICVVNLDKLYNKDTIFTSAREPAHNNIWNAFIGVQPNSPIINVCLNISVSNVLHKITNIDVLSLTGPGVLGKALNISLNKTMNKSHITGYLIFENDNNMVLYQNNTPPNCHMSADNKIILISKWKGYQSDKYSNRNWYR